jgi:hypothetical protein
MQLPVFGAGELVNRFRSESGMGTWLGLIAPELRLPSVLSELENALSALNLSFLYIQLDRSVKPLIDAPNNTPIVVTGFGTLSDEEWQHLDQLRSSRTIRNEPALLLMSSTSMLRLVRLAPNMTSFFGGQFFEFQEDAGRLTEEERSNRLAELQHQFEMTNDQFLAMVASRAILDEPAYAEWLVLLDRGDLLKR